VRTGITKCLKQDWIQIDRGYLDRINERKSTLAKQPEKALAANPACIPAVLELFNSVIEHLVIRFPTMFKQEGSKFENLITHKTYDLAKTRQETNSMQRMIAENVEEDFYIMCPDKDGIFSLQGFVSCFPGGFLTLGKLGQSMSEIHSGVPGLNETIGKGIARFMALMRGGSIVQRWNVSNFFLEMLELQDVANRCKWSFQFDGTELFRTGGNNFYPKEGDVVGDVSEDQNLDQCFLRIERQTLVCLAESKAIVFCIRQYLTPIQQVKAEGNGEALIRAIESMPEKLGYYKKRPFWERDVSNFLRNMPVA